MYMACRAAPRSSCRKLRVSCASAQNDPIDQKMTTMVTLLSVALLGAIALPLATRAERITTLPGLVGDWPPEVQLYSGYLRVGPVIMYRPPRTPTHKIFTACSLSSRAVRFRD